MINMKKLILVALTAISVVSFANDTKKILEQYRKEALMEQSRVEKEVKVKPEKKPSKKMTFQPVDEVVEEVTVEEVVENVDDGRTHTTDDVIEKVNFYLQNNPEKNAKLQRRYRAVVGQE
jgi:hypothetical protein